MSTKLPAIPGVWLNSIRCPFGSSLFDGVVGLDGGHDRAATNCLHYDKTQVLVEQSRGQLILHPRDNKADPSTLIPFGRARNCPPLGSTACPTTVPSTQAATFWQERSPRQQFVQLAVVGLVFSKQNELLITRRPSHMRSFPGAWVFPGGSVDAEDGCLEAAVSREILEETGIDTVQGDWTIRSAWESVFPTVPEQDVPIKRHHLVIYLSTTLQDKTLPSLKLCDEEVEGAVWLTKENVDAILSQSLDLREDASDLDKFPPEVEMLLGPFASSSTQKVPLHHLAGIFPQFNNNEQNVHSTPFGMAQGSLFALEEFCMLS